LLNQGIVHGHDALGCVLLALQAIGDAMKPRTGTDNDDASTGLPWPATWRGVYLFVIASFILWVVLLAALAEVYS
jgi:hypothetical protein